jgi:hypothetical protein
MKKKWLILGSTIGISTVVMVTTGFTALAGTSGYDAYKSALKQSRTAANVSVQANAVLQDNGMVLNDATGTVKVSLADHSASGTLKLTGNGKQQTLDMYKLPNGSVWKSSDSNVYVVKQQNPDRQKDERPDQGSGWMNQQAETVIDALVGNLKNDVTVSSQDNGSKQVALQLDSAQIPAVLQALAPLAFQQLSSEQGNERGAAVASGQADAEDLFKASLFNVKDLALTQNIQIAKISMNALINSSNYIDHHQASITFTGQDANGAAHEITMNIDLKLTDYNVTKPDSIDLTSKQVKQLNDDDHGDHAE